MVRGSDLRKGDTVERAVLVCWECQGAPESWINGVVATQGSSIAVIDAGHLQLRSKTRKQRAELTSGTDNECWLAVERDVKPSQFQ